MRLADGLSRPWSEVFGDLVTAGQSDLRVTWLGEPGPGPLVVRLVREEPAAVSVLLVSPLPAAWIGAERHGC